MPPDVAPVDGDVHGDVVPPHFAPADDNVHTDTPVDNHAVFPDSYTRTSCPRTTCPMTMTPNKVPSLNKDNTVPSSYEDPT